MDPRPPERPYTATHLFTIRAWMEEVGTPASPQAEWRGQVQHLATGGVYYFRDWPALVTHLQTLAATLAAGTSLARANGPPTGGAAGDPEYHP